MKKPTKRVRSEVMWMAKAKNGNDLLPWGWGDSPQMVVDRMSAATPLWHRHEYTIVRVRITPLAARRVRK